MRLAARLASAGSSVLLVTGCATGGGTAADSGEALDRACTVTDCFYERDVRDFEVIDNTTLIVYVGGQRCPFRVELDGTFCDMTMAPEVFFRSDRRGIDQERAFSSNRICSYDRVGVDGGVFTESFGQPPADPFGNPSQCRIRDVASLTDDQLVELYVARGVVSPPPPIGPGTIEVSEEQSEEGVTEGAEAGPASGGPRQDSGAQRAEPQAGVERPGEDGSDRS